MPAASEWTLLGKTCIVTGANTGIGKETALELARQGGKVIFACRNMVAAEKAIESIQIELGFTEKMAEQKLIARYLDLSSLESIKNFADDIIETEHELHLLVNNAGVLPPDQRTMNSDETFELTFVTNHLGPFYLTHLLIPLLTKSAPSRIVNVSSVGYKLCKKVGGYNIEDPQYENDPSKYEPWMAYCQTKLANILTTQQLANRLENSGISVFSVHPGTVKTEIFRHRSIKFSIFCGPIVAIIGRTPKQGAKPVVNCCCNPEIESHSGSYFV